jgi:hypothetical protein
MVATLACATHWYVSGLFTVPTVLVGGWSWWSSRRVDGLGEDGEAFDGDGQAPEPDARSGTETSSES